MLVETHKTLAVKIHAMSADEPIASEYRAAASRNKLVIATVLRESHNARFVLEGALSDSLLLTGGRTVYLENTGISYCDCDSTDCLHLPDRKADEGIKTLCFSLFRDGFIIQRNRTIELDSDDFAKRQNPVWALTAPDTLATHSIFCTRGQTNNRPVDQGIYSTGLVFPVEALL